MLKRKLFRTAWGYRAQFLSMILMIALGMGIFLGFNIEWKSIEEDTSAFFEDTLYADFRLYSEAGFSEADADSIREIDGVDAATRYLSVNLDLKDNSAKSLSLDVSEDFTVSTFLVTDGEEYDDSSGGVWLSDKFAEENGYAVGDTLALEYQGKEISGEIVGLIKSAEHMICVADANQLMPDYSKYGYAYISPKKLEDALGFAFYPQVNVISSMEKKDLEEAVKDALGVTVQVVSKDDHVVYKEANGEADEGKTMGSILPVLFLAIAVLTMVTTMHRIATNEKTQIGTLKALGFKNRRILLHYTSYGFVIGVFGTALGVLLGYGVAAYIMNQNGMMGTYFDMPYWDLRMPAFCVPVMAATVTALTLIGFFSVRRQLTGNAAETLRPYVPKNIKKSVFERLKSWDKWKFQTKWNLRDVMRHKSRSAMTLIGILGCMILMVGGLGMKDTMAGFLDLLDSGISNYTTKVNLVENADFLEAERLADDLGGDWVSSSGVSLGGDTVVLEIYENPHGFIRVVDEKNDPIEMAGDGVYLCQRLKDRAKIGETVTFSPYGSDDTFKATVAGYCRSVMTEGISMTRTYADELGVDYTVSSVYTDLSSDEIEKNDLIAGKQDKTRLMETYDSFTEIMDTMVFVLVIAAAVLGVVVLYNLGVMSYIERRGELATLKVLGFRDRKIGTLLITQNLWLTVIGVILGIPAGVGVLSWLVAALAGEYELKIMLGPLTYCVSVLLTFGVSLLVGLLVAGKNKKIDMVEALKGTE